MAMGEKRVLSDARSPDDAEQLDEQIYRKLR